MATKTLNLKNLSSQSLLEITSDLVKKERGITGEILNHLKEIDHRKLYANLGYSSLIEYCIKDLKYSESAAYRRVQSMKLIRDLPALAQKEVAEKIDQGSLNLNQLAQAQSVFQKAKRELKKHTSPQEKREILQKIEGQSFRATEKLLYAMEPKLSNFAQESARCVSSEKTQVTLVMSHETYEDLKLIQEELMGRKNLSEIVAMLTKEHLARRNKLKMKHLNIKEKSDKNLKQNKGSGQNDIDTNNRSRCGKQRVLADQVPKNSKKYLVSSWRSERVQNQSRNAAPASVFEKNERNERNERNELILQPLRISTVVRKSKSLLPNSKKLEGVSKAATKRPIPASIRRNVLERSNYSCEFVSPITQRRCGSKKFLELDHIENFSHSKSHEASNLQTLCSTHHRFKSENT